MTPQEIQQAVDALRRNVGSVIIGKDKVTYRALVCLFARGHLLIEDVPGVGKTVLARAIARSIHAVYKRVQFTPDLLPSDITGGNVFNQKEMKFEFHRGPVFTQLLLADEINRATPRTQSSLLEAMEERQVSVDGVSHKLDELFFVLATENPVELQGTYPLPEAQLDRFMMRLSLGYPELDQEIAILDSQSKAHPLLNLQPVVTVEQVMEIQNRVGSVLVHTPIRRYITQIVAETRKHDHVLLGVSPRGSIALMKAAQTQALIEGKAFVSPENVKDLAIQVLAHRMLVRPQSRLKGVKAGEIIDEVLRTVEVPTQYEGEE